VPHLSPTTLTTDEQRLVLRATAGNVRDHTIVSLALGTGLRLGEIVGLDVGDVFALDGAPRVRVRVRAAIAHLLPFTPGQGEHSRDPLTAPVPVDHTRLVTRWTDGMTPRRSCVPSNQVG